MQRQDKQQGAAIIILMLILALAISVLFGGLFNSHAQQLRADNKTSDALQRARNALISDAVSQTPVYSAGYLRMPDLGFKIGNLPSEGSAAPNFSGNNKDYSVAGRLPWRTLGLEPLRDGSNECLWYLVSGRFKSTPATDTLNWDTEGQIDIADGKGNIIHAGVAALLISPGAVLDEQVRISADPAYVQCGGNYDARNYLDPYSPTDAITGTLNYFSGSTNNRIAANTANKRVLMIDASHYNDRFLPITPGDIFNALIKRTDFRSQITMLLDDPYFSTVAITGSKGTGSINCNQLASGNREFCKNWGEMLLLTQLPVPAPAVVDGTPSANCSRILFFGGRKNANQTRKTAADKAAPANYLEGNNPLLFSVPVAHAGNFSGASAFNAAAPENDLLKCLP